MPERLLESDGWMVPVWDTVPCPPPRLLWQGGEQRSSARQLQAVQNHWGALGMSDFGKHPQTMPQVQPCLPYGETLHVPAQLIDDCVLSPQQIMEAFQTHSVVAEDRRPLERRLSVEDRAWLEALVMADLGRMTLEALAAECAAHGYDVDLGLAALHSEYWATLTRWEDRDEAAEPLYEQCGHGDTPREALLQAVQRSVEQLGKEA